MKIPYFIKFQNQIGDDLIDVTGNGVVGFTRTVLIPDTPGFVDPSGNNVNINNVVAIQHYISFVYEYDQDIVSVLNGIRNVVIPTKMILNSGTEITITESPNDVFTF